MRLRAGIITKLQLLQRGVLVLPKAKNPSITRSGATSLLQGVPKLARLCLHSGKGLVIPLHWAGVIGGGLVFIGQTVYHTYRYFRGQITLEQLTKYTTVNFTANSAVVVGGIGGALLGSHLPIVGTFVGGIIGAILGGTLMGWITEKIGMVIGNNIVVEEEHFKKAQQCKQLKYSLKILHLTEKNATRETIETQRNQLFLEYQQKESRDKFLAVYTAYLCVMKEMGVGSE